MRVFQISRGRFLLQLEHGEEIKDKLLAFLEEHEVGAGVLRGLGAAESAELDFYHLSDQRHETFRLDEPTEVSSLVGNLTRGEDGRAIAHVHATFSRRDGTTLGGHVERLVVGATLEIDMEVLPGTLRRKLDPSVGLALQHTYEQKSRPSNDLKRRTHLAPER